MSLKAVFRTDASLEIGTGHVMRCLTLADALRDQGVKCHFICREHPGHLMSRIRAAGHEVHPLPLVRLWEHATGGLDVTMLAHAEWLGTSQEQDAEACMLILRSLYPDWLIVDHYALDVRWEAVQRPYCRKLMVIDDLTDRKHDCDFLLDQTFGRQDEDYQPLVPQRCMLLCGSQYALLRPEFAQWRPYSLARREGQELKHLLIAMGGVDRDNATGRILDALMPGSLPKDCRVSVVMGEHAPWLNEVRLKANMLPWSASVLVGVAGMAQLMADSDLAIGAGGATSWERCCLGLPTALMVLAENQKKASIELERMGAVSILDDNQLEASVRAFLLRVCIPGFLEGFSKNSSSVTDGRGVERVLELISMGG